MTDPNFEGTWRVRITPQAQAIFEKIQSQYSRGSDEHARNQGALLAACAQLHNSRAWIKRQKHPTADAWCFFEPPLKLFFHENGSERLRLVIDVIELDYS